MGNQECRGARAFGAVDERQDQLEPNDVLVVNDVKKLSQKQKDWMLAAARA